MTYLTQYFSDVGCSHETIHIYIDNCAILLDDSILSQCILRREVY